MKETIIVLSILLGVLAISLVVICFLFKIKINKEKENAVGEFFSLLLAGGYQKRVDDFKIYNKTVVKDGIVFVGDSLTENYNVYEYFKELNVYNRGIGGDTTLGLLKRMNESVYDLNPKVVVLLIGINDFELLENSNVETIYNNILTIVNNIKSNCPNTKIILQSLYPVCKKDDPKIDKSCVINKDNEKIVKINNKIKNIEDVTYLDVYSSLVDETSNLKIEYTIEGLHINTLGYELITKLIIKELEKDL